MIYHSTRNEQLTASSTHAVLQGIAPDGGLYICDPAALRFDWRAALEKDTLSMAADILHALLPDFQDMDRLVRDSYAGKFPTSDLTPLTPVADKYVLELYHGPTSAFKDVALSVLPRLIVAAAKAEGMKGDVVILTATSGDTGKAAMEGFHDVPGTRITVFYPYGGVSAVQQAQMATQEGANVRVCAVRGNFDDAQTGVKKLFSDEKLRQELARHAEAVRPVPVAAHTPPQPEPSAAQSPRPEPEAEQPPQPGPEAPQPAQPDWKPQTRLEHLSVELMNWFDDMMGA